MGIRCAIMVLCCGALIGNDGMVDEHDQRQEGAAAVDGEVARLGCWRRLDFRNPRPALEAQGYVALDLECPNTNDVRLRAERYDNDFRHRGTCYRGGDIATTAFTDDGDMGSINSERSGIFDDIFRHRVCLLNSDGILTLEAAAEFHDHHDGANADGKFASEPIMRGRVSQGPASSVEEQDDRHGIWNFRGTDEA